ncbi:MAG TPA: GtrA family protein [Frateuria sp.]|uniref:GtrA family protein n=1 Tax=Frateuria sp. TaxID=2211372 RepID=UPI002DE55FBC|nr:GtrA family protein [Frateuria sp.]
MKTILAHLRRPFLHRAWFGEVLRFLIGGVLNVIVGYGGYLILLHLFRYEVAYAFAYLLGIVVSYVFSTLYVFRQPMRWRSALRYPLVYLLQFLLGLILLKILVELVHMPQRFAPLAVAVLTIPATFLASRTIVRTN